MADATTTNIDANAATNEPKATQPADKPAAKGNTKRVLNDTRPAPRRTLAEGKKLTKDEKELVIDAKAKTVNTTYTVKMNKDAPHAYVMTSLFDYSRCSMEEILTLANSSVVISAQSLLRALKEDQIRDPKTFSNVDVKAVIIDTERSTADPETRAVASLARANLETVVETMSDEQAAALLKALQAKKKARAA